MRFTRFISVVAVLPVLALLSAPAAEADFDAPVELDSGAMGTAAYSPKVVMRPAGDAYIVWERAGNGTNVIQGRPFIGGSGFGATQDLSTVTTGRDPDVAMSSTGKIVAVWRSLIGSHYRVQAASGVFGGQLNPAETLSPNGINVNTVRTAINAKGDIIVVWEREDGRMLARFRPAGGTFGAAAIVSPAGEVASAPKVVIANDGSVLVLWSVVTGGKVKVRARSNSGAWSAPKLIDSAYSYNPDIAITPAGTALIAWQVSGAINTRTRSPAGVYSAIKPLSGHSYNGPRVAMNAKGNALIVWATAAPTGGPPRIYVRSRSANGSLGPLQIITPANRNAYTPQVAINAKGEGVIIYLYDLNPSATNDKIVRARTRSAGGVLGPAENLSATGADASVLGIGMATNGSALATWNRQDTTTAASRVQAAVGH